MPPRKKDAAALRHQRQVRRFQSAYGDMLGVIDESLSECDTERIIDQVEQRVDQAPDSVEGFRDWAMRETRRLSNLTAVVINNFDCPDWLLEKLAEYTGAADDLESLGRWLSRETGNHEKCVKENAELCKSLFEDNQCRFAVRAGIKFVLKGSGGLGVNDALAEIENLVWTWILCHGEQLRVRNSRSDTNWPGRLYKLAQWQTRGWKTNRVRDKRKLRSIGPLLDGVSRAGIPVDGRQVIPRPSASYQDWNAQGSRLADRLQCGS
jgi:hypothetical protein